MADRLSPSKAARQSETFVADIESRAIPKINRAVDHFRTVEREAIEWIATQQPLISATLISHEEPNVLQMFEPIGFEPPLTSWENAFSDGVHNLREALDAFAMEIAYLDSGHVANEGQIAFPIVGYDSSSDPERAWSTSSAVKAMSKTVPSSLMERFRAVQPWSHPSTHTNDFLKVLADVDNDEKHRFGIEIRLFPSKITGLSEITPPAVSSVDVWATDWYRATLPKDLLPQCALLNLEDNLFPLVSFRSGTAHLFDLQLTLLEDTKRCLSFLATGIWPERSELSLRAGEPVVSDGVFPNMRREALRKSHPAAPQG